MAATTEVREHTIATNGVDLHVLEAGAGPAVLLVHGFPELGFSWRHQVPALAEAGYRVIVPDMRGYGRSSCPTEITSYDIHNLTADLVGVLDALGEEQVVVVGHDWGSMVASQLLLLRPTRVRALVNCSVPFLPRGDHPPIATMRHVFGDSFFYIVYFQEPGVADAELGGDPARTMRRLLAGLADPSALAAPPVTEGGFVDRMPEPTGMPDWLTQAELDHYTAEFTRTGFTGGINWYRNMDRNWETTADQAGVKVTVPSLFIGGTLDPVLLMSPPSSAHGSVTQHRGDVLVEGAGHWVQQEKPAEVNEALLTFLAGLG